jgi:hypothetical protein
MGRGFRRCFSRFCPWTTFFFLLFINDITKVPSKGANIFLYVDDTSIIVTNPEYNGYKLIINKTFQEVNTWFKSNLLTLNLEKTYHLQFITTNHDVVEKNISLGQKQVVNSNCIKFLGLYIDNKLSWKTHCDHLVTKLSTICSVMRMLKPIMSFSSLRMLYFAYLQSIMIYGTIFWVNSPYSVKLFRIQKRVIEIIKGLKSRDSFQEMKILPLCSQYVYSLM